MPYVKNYYPPPPELPALNYYTLIFEHLAGNVPHDFVVQIDGLTDEKRTYSQFVERTRDCATALSAPIGDGGLGIGQDAKRKDIIVILSPNTLDYAVLVFSALALAVPFCSLPSKPTRGELVYLLKKVKAGKSHRIRLFSHFSLLKLAKEASKDVGIPSEHIYTLDGGGTVSDRNLSHLIQSVRSKAFPRQPVASVEKNALAYLVFSSGTSGLPKAVMVSHDNLCFSMMQTAIHHTVDMQNAPPPADAPAAVWLAFLPFYHSFGLHFSVLKAFVSPVTMVILPGWNLDQALEAIPKYKVNFFAGVPSIIHQMAHSPKVARSDLSSLLKAGSGAAYLPPDVAAKFQQTTGLPSNEKEAIFSEGYGLSESTIGSIGRPGLGVFDLPYDAKCTGILLPGQEARIVRDDGSDVDYNEPGELWLKGGNVTMGYWGDEQATRDTFVTGGWLRTGDRFRVNEAGVFFFEDRAKDTLKISGSQVAPSEIERVLLSHPEGIAIDAAVAGVPSSSTRDEKQPRAWIALGPQGKEIGELESTKKLDAWVREQLSRYKWLSGGIEIVDEIPKSPTGKVLRRVLVEGFVKGKGKKGTSAKL